MSEEEAMTETRVIGLDVGYGYTKGKGPGRIVTVFPSVVGPAVDVKYHNDLISNGRGLEVELDGARWFVGDMARLQSPSPTSPKARNRDLSIVNLLTLGALYNLQAMGDVTLITGLPVEWYEDRGEMVEELRGGHTFLVNGDRCEVMISEALVVPQPFGSFFRMFLAPDGALRDPDGLTRKRVAILDIGMHTADFALSDALRYVEPRSGSVPTAMARTYELVGREVGRRYGRSLSLDESEVAVNTRVITDRDQEIDVTDITRQALDAVAQTVLGKANELWGDARDISAVLVTGGGGPAFFEYIETVYPHARLLSDPQTANAEGFYRYGLRKHG